MFEWDSCRIHLHERSTHNQRHRINDVFSLNHLSRIASSGREMSCLLCAIDKAFIIVVLCLIVCVDICIFRYIGATLKQLVLGRTTSRVVNYVDRAHVF